jgi:DNA-binding NarL/FixJ family response regulator
MMPEMNGDAVARRLRQKYPALKVLYYTGFADRLFDEKRTMWEDEAYLEKPSGVRGLLEAVSLLWNGNRRIDVQSAQ